MINYADIIETKNGDVIIAVKSGDLEYGPRVGIKIGDGYFDIIQSAVVFGHIEKLPRSTFDVLRACGSVRVVEVQTSGEKKITAIHEAVVSSIGTADADDITSSYTTFRNRLQKLSSTGNKGKELAL